MFRKETYIGRRECLKREVGGGVLLFLGNGESGMNYVDNTYPFRQDSTFLYYFGLDCAGLAAVIDVDENKEIIFGDELTIDDIVWMGTQPTIREKSESVGVGATCPMKELRAYLQKARAAGRTVHYLPPYRGEHQVWLQELLDIKPSAQQQGVSATFVKAVVGQRSIKTAEEIAQIEEAVTISADMHIKAMQMIRPGMREAEVAAAVTDIALRDGAGISFPVIATVHGQTLHNHYHGHVAQEGDMFLVDAGAENAMHYAGDLSSTFPVGKRFTERQRVIYDICLRAHRAAVATLHPGTPNKEVHLKAAETIAEGMKSLGLMKGNPRDAAESGAYALFFPCGVGHMMGLDVHDMENLGENYVGYGDGFERNPLFGLKSLRLAKKLQPGYVLTIEPGIYFIPELIDRWRGEKKFTDFINYDEVEKYRDFGGLRNEEDYLITPDGKRRLGKYVPMTIDEVEALRS